MIVSQDSVGKRAKALGIELRYRYDGWANAPCFAGSKDQWVLFFGTEVHTFPHLLDVSNALSKLEASTI
jgi:hypothetical protein